MAERKKIMNAKEMEEWLIKKGVVPISQKIQKEPWYEKVKKIPSCIKPSKIAEDGTYYKKEKRDKSKKILKYE